MIPLGITVRRLILSGALQFGGSAPAEEPAAEPDLENEKNSIQVVPQTDEGQGPTQVHQVEKGDTLWDLSQKYLGSAWYWPKVWSYNPELANPHVITPGMNLKFFSSGDGAPARVELERPEPVVEKSDNGESQTVQVSGKIGYAGPKTVRIINQGFVTQDELNQAGEIVGSFSESYMLSFPDQAYVKFKNNSEAKIGDRYIIFRPGEMIIHPVTKKKFGRLTHFLGVLKVISTQQDTVTCQIEKTWDEVNRGDRIGPYEDRMVERVSEKPNELGLDGYVVTSLSPFVTLLGENNFIVVDQGSASGVKIGNTFTVLHRGDLLRPKAIFPEEPVARCVVVEVKEVASTCLVTRSLREISKGDRVQMKVSTASSGALR